MSRYLKYYILSLCNIIFCLTISYFQYTTDTWVIHQAWKSSVWYRLISMPNNITRQYKRRIYNPVERLRRRSFTKIVNDYKPLTNFAIKALCKRFDWYPSNYCTPLIIVRHLDAFGQSNKFQKKIKNKFRNIQQTTLDRP